ncbi:MAG: AIR synthase related protein, partial [Halanaerobiales bacterium]
MKIGKIPGKKLEEIILNKISFKRDDVLLHAGLGEDSAVVDLQGGLLAISSDPITGTAQNAGYLAVHVACNDLAAVGAEPIGIQVILLLPANIEEAEITQLMQEIIETAASIGVEVLGGHTEILSLVSKPIVCITAVGRIKNNNYVSSSASLPGDDILITKGVGIEGTYILANDYPDLLKEKGISQATIDKALKYKDKISVLKEGLLAAEYGVHAMHDVTEGG